MSKAHTVPCPTCGAAALAACIGNSGQERIGCHTERWAAAQTGRQVKPKKPKRFGAYLRLYGPLNARTHALLVLGHEPRPNTPEAFLLEMEEERRYSRHAASYADSVVVLAPKIVTRY